VNPKYAGFFVRLIADIIDSVLLTLLAWGPTLLTERVMEGIQPLTSLEVQFVDMAYYFLFAAPYYIYGHFRFGTTLGKLPFRIYVVQFPGASGITLKQSSVRFLSYLLSYATFLIGFVMIYFHPEKRGLHELLSGTMSIRRPKKIVKE
jgi:uncharacterized RDD family membrane protein YckC